MNLPAEPGKTEEYYYFTDEDGNLHKASLDTGQIVESAPRFEDHLVKGTPINPLFVKGNAQFWHYNEVYKDLVANHIAAGRTMSWVCKQPGFPSTSIMMKWRLQHNDFDDAIRAAYKARAEFRADQIADSLAETAELDKEDVPAAKLLYEQRKWLAEKDDPDRYGNRIKHSGDTENPMIIQVNTGVDTTPLPEPEDENVIDITEHKENE